MSTLAEELKKIEEEPRPAHRCALAVELAKLDPESQASFDRALRSEDKRMSAPFLAAVLLKVGIEVGREGVRNHRNYILGRQGKCSCRD